MTLQILCELGTVHAGDREISRGGAQTLGLQELPIEIAAEPLTADWRVLLTHAGGLEDPAINVVVMYGSLMGEQYRLTPAALSRFGCSVVIEGEAGDRVLISQAEALQPAVVSPAT